MNVWTFQPENFGELLPYVRDDLVTDINFNGIDVWIDHLYRGRYRADIKLSEDFVSQFATRISNVVSKSFNKFNNLLEAETETLRVSIIHESVASTGTSISIRKTSPARRLTEDSMLKDGYCVPEMLVFLENCIRAHMNLIMTGLPGSGKTELLKFLTKYIPENERVITIEDNLEIHYRSINPQKDCVELKVNEEFFDYTKAIKSCLRQNPKWIMLSEARSTEVKYLLEAMSTGTHCLTTLHTDDVNKVPDRIQNMMKDTVSPQRIENDVFSFVDAGILIRKGADLGEGIRRYMDQICFYSRENGKNKIVMMAEGGSIINRSLPPDIKRKFSFAGIDDPFLSKERMNEL